MEELLINYALKKASENNNSARKTSKIAEWTRGKINNKIGD